jgi:hypothetical protein
METHGPGFGILVETLRRVNVAPQPGEAGTLAGDLD